ncbi:tetratricopeptide repeat protein [Catellatospora bangladeshensis]|uniref:Sel1 repeat family protein n=1 Tax=Catellatospora bangladeshensis TaxID=310355 RepID=A0A8J3JPW0_9ACTN|nr:sel1 repeat family protein [Catellatospora bangladeshensis]GIF81099.1 hypothetical protein Cba03nite_24480 [Catellatospora bangladeshensis]
MVLFVAAAVLTIWGFAADSGGLRTAGWIVWGLGVLWVWVTSGGRFGLRATMVRRMLRDTGQLALAAAQGDPVAMRTLGLAYKINGDLDAAELWLRRAAEAGDAEALFDMGRLVEQHRGLAESEEWFRGAAERGHAVARAMFAEGGVFHPDRPRG